jgi:hypothetical protein
MSDQAKRFSLFGLALVLIGALLLVDRLHILSIGPGMIYLPIFMLLGLVLAVRGFSAGRQGKVFWGTVIFLFAIYFLMKRTNFWDFHFYMMPAATFLILGIGFVMMFVNNPREWAVLIPAILIGGLGVTLVLIEHGYLYQWDVWDVARLWWPVAIILIGLSLLLRKRAHKASPAVPPGQTPVM